jgi:folate-binding Fe-S cluster repair protein YgfZ
VIRVEGEDAAKFLHGQLTQDFALLDMQHARLFRAVYFPDSGSFAAAAPCFFFPFKALPCTSL